MASVIRGSGTSSLGGDLDIEGVLTYEDVASVDSVGVITARSGIVIDTQSTSVNPLSVGSKGGGTNDGHLEGEGPKINFLATRGADGAVGGAAYIQQKAIGDLSSSYPVDLAFGVRRFGSSFEAMRILSTGNVGIGTTTTASKLEVNGTVRSNEGYTVYPPSDSNYSFATRNAANDKWSAFIEASGKGTFDSLVIDGDVAGLVGIGTNAPEEVLHILGPTEAVNSRDGVMLQHSTANANANTGLPIVWSGHIGSQVNYGLASICGRKENSNSADAAAYLQFATCNTPGALTERLRIDSSGRALIGNSTNFITYPTSSTSNSSGGTNASQGILHLGFGGPIISRYARLPAGDYIDLTINTTSSGIWTGILCITVADLSNGANRRGYVYSVHAANQYSAFNAVQLQTQTNGTGTNFTLTYEATGKLRITNNTSITEEIAATFIGALC
tara:strand:+ start:383 stop:1717 length:1335 start_codon:yes stop_codon:yes gene_type:complete